jgi:tetratricopeptide (TPR) repeat protein/2-polyprenyl-3-methyl-5-hydroxy-6-metoxy-1,4-benzoquinol methylase
VSNVKKTIPDTEARKAAVALIDAGNSLEEQGLSAEAMTRYDEAARTDPSCARAHLNRGNILLATGKIDAARKAYEEAIVCDNDYAAAHFNLGNLNARTGDHTAALKDYTTAVRIKADFADAFVAMGNAYESLGRNSEAMRSYERALNLVPNYAEVYFNLGVLASTEGLHQKAIDSLRKAIELRPEYAEAHCALAKVLQTLGHLDAAEASLRRACALAPQSEEFLSDLALLLRQVGKASQALDLLVPELERAPTNLLKYAFGVCAARTRFLVSSERVRRALTSAIQGPWTDPYTLCWPALSLVMLDPKIAACVARALSPAAPMKETDIFGADGLRALADDDLLHAILETAAVSTLEFELFLTATRRALLARAAETTANAAMEQAGLPFFAALAQQCFINEYIFAADEKETAAAEACRNRLLAILDATNTVPPLLLLAVAAYFPLHSLLDPARLLVTEYPAAVARVLRQQVREPLEERALRARIRQITPITAGVSEAVRSQYEQNPYPRWMKVASLQDSLPVNREIRRTHPLSKFSPLPDDSHPEVLIAGCGTGRQPILASRRYSAARVLAVDLSLSSISYAMRKTQELGITSIEYAQADIEKLGEISREFDVIECAGVLHHLADPFSGWRILLSRLRPGGLMRLGFYSQLARRHVTNARMVIASRGLTGSASDIRRFRRDLAVGAGPELQWLTNTSDFFSMSECRDLLFHVQEHCLSLPEIAAFLKAENLRFIGFEHDEEINHSYRQRFPNDPSGTDLENWAKFEVDHPDTFAAMYQFWIQKPP